MPEVRHITKCEVPGVTLVQDGAGFALDYDGSDGGGGHWPPVTITLNPQIKYEIIISLLAQSRPEFDSGFPTEF